MLVHKYYCRPADAHSEATALDEIARYVQARNGLLRLREKWLRIREEMILPEYRALAATYRATPRTGRKPTKERADHAELRAADNRALYAEFIAAGGSYATWWLAEKASKKAKHPVRDEYAGRAGILPERLRWEGNMVHYHGTTWSVRPQQLARRLVPEHGHVVQAWLQRERVSPAAVPRARYYWFLVLVFNNLAPRMHAVRDNRTAAGLDLAWRQDEDTLRVAYVAAENGKHRALRMAAGQYERLQHATGLQAIADLEANRLRAELGVPINTSYRRLIELAPNHPLTVHLIHLLEWHHGARRNTIASRDEYYLQTVHQLCATHHTIYVEKMKASPRLVQRAGTRKKKGAGDDAKGGVARDQRQAVAPFTFLRLLQREAPKFATEIVECPAEYTSRVCVACDYDMGPWSKRERTCGGCGQRWDIDHLAALNLLRWGVARKPEDSAAE